MEKPLRLSEAKSLKPCSFGAMLSCKELDTYPPFKNTTNPALCEHAPSFAASLATTGADWKVMQYEGALSVWWQDPGTARTVSFGSEYAVAVEDASCYMFPKQPNPLEDDILVCSCLLRSLCKSSGSRRNIWIILLQQDMLSCRPDSKP